MNRVRLSPAASLTPTETGVILRSDLGTFRLHGADVGVFAGKIVPLLDGTLTREEISTGIEGYSEASVLKFLELLDDRGLLETVKSDPEAKQIGPQERFAQTLSSNFLDKLPGKCVLVAGLEPWGAVAAAELAATGVGKLLLADDRMVNAEDLVSARIWEGAEPGVPRNDALKAILSKGHPECEVDCLPLELDSDQRFSPEADACDLMLCGLNPDDHYLLHPLARFAQEREITSLYGHLDGLEAWTGPATVPGTSGCWNCFRLRKLANADNLQGAHEEDAARMGARAPERARALLAPMAPLAGHAMAMDALRLLGLTDDPAMPGTYRVQDLLKGEVKSHRFVPMPWCGVCGGASELTKAQDEAGEGSDGEDRPFVLELVRDSDGLRELLDGWIDPRTGVISELMASPTGQANVLPRTASASVAIFTTGHIHGDPQPLIGSGKSMNQLGAEIGALGEAIERYSASRFRFQDMRYARIDELEGDAIDPGKLALYSPEQYQNESFPCTPWEASKSIHWTEGRWFGSEDPVWVPALPTYFNFMAPRHERFCQVSSNGLAAGGDFQDAATRATFELLERDAFMLTWLCQIPARQLIIDTDLNNDLAAVVEQIEDQGAELEFWVLDVGTGIPTVVSLGFGDGQAWGGTSLGLSCHADIRTALAKALMEQAHFGPYLTRLMQTSKIPETPEQVLTLEDHALYYVPPERSSCFDFMRDKEAEPVLLSAAGAEPPLAGSELHEHVAGQLKQAGLRIATVDVTSPDVRLSPFRVARALGEYVQPIHFGYHMRPLANERLQDFLAGRPVNPDPHPIA